MLFNNESRHEPPFHRTGVRDKLRLQISGWTLGSVNGILRAVVGTAAYIALCLPLHTMAPDFYLMPQEWSWNLTGGLSFGFLMAFGLAYVPVVLLVYLMPLWVEGATAASLWPIVLFAAGNTAVFGFARYMARRAMKGTDIDLEDRRALVVILILIPFTAAVSASFSTVNWWLADVLVPDTFFQSFLTKTLGNGLGLLLAGPFVLLNLTPLLNKLVKRSNPLGMIETIELVLGAALLHAAAGSVIAMGLVGMDRFEAYLLLFAPLLAMALKFGLRGLAASFLAVGFGGTVMTFLGYTALDGLRMQTTIAVAMLSTLIVAALATERTRAMNTVRRQAALVRDAVVKSGQEGFDTPDTEVDFEEALEHLVREIEPAAAPVIAKDDQTGYKGLSERLEKLINDHNRRLENRLAMKDLRG